MASAKVKRGLRVSGARGDRTEDKGRPRCRRPAQGDGGRKGRDGGDWSGVGDGAKEDLTTANKGRPWKCVTSVSNKYIVHYFSRFQKNLN